jgi:glycosyltransferase involved in cell wall biosynthesis
MDVFGGIASKLTSILFILSERSCKYNYPPTFKNNIRIIVGRLAAAIVSNSQGGSQYWQMHAGDSVSTYVINNALPLADIEEIERSSCDLHLPPASKVILFAGRFSPEKNIHTIVRAFKIVLKRQDAVLLLCGEGELQCQIEDLIREENLTSRIILLGYVKNIWSLMKFADILISISDYEGCPNTVLEAMACGCPLIISDIAAHRAFLDEGKALLVDPRREVDIANAILTCLVNRESTQQMTQKAKANAPSFSIHAVTDKYEKIYNHILLKSNKGKH